MPKIHTFRIPVFLDPLPIAIPRPVEVLRRPGMAGSSVLFHARQFDPLTIRTISSSRNQVTAFSLAKDYLSLVRSRVKVDDGVIYANQTVVLAVVSITAFSGLVIGGNTPGDAWIVNTTWTFLLDADEDRA